MFIASYRISIHTKYAVFQISLKEVLLGKGSFLIAKPMDQVIDK